MYHFSDEQWNILKATLKDNKDGFTDDQLKMANNLLSENRLNDEKFKIFVDMLDISTQKLVLLHAGGGTGKTFVTCKIFEEFARRNEIVIAHVQLGWVLCTYHKVKLSIVFSRHGHLT